MSAEARRRTGHLDAVAFCVAGVTLSAHQARFAWQAWYFRISVEAWRRTGHLDAAAFWVAGVALSAYPRKLGPAGSTFPRRMFPSDRNSCNLSLILYSTYYNVIDVTFRFHAAAC